MRNIAARLLGMACCLPLASGAETKSTTFQVSATIAAGCEFGNEPGPGSDARFGTIDFGEHFTLDSGVNAASSVGAGTLLVACTPGTSVTIALDYGVNGGGRERYVINDRGTRTLRYQLYKDAGYSQVWGMGSDARTIASFPASPQAYTVFARLFPVSGRPPAGIYTDTVTVTLTY